MRGYSLLPAFLLLVSCAPIAAPTTATPSDQEVSRPAPRLAAAPSSELDERSPRLGPAEESDGASETVAAGAKTVADLPLVTASAETPYDRANWNHWIDADGDCQDTRAEVLIAQSKQPVKFATSKECRVVSGFWVDPYTGETFTEARQLDIDHVVTLKDAHDSGAWRWSDDQREAFANDPGNLLAVSASTNRSKGAKDPAHWLPAVAATSDVCWYLEHWVRVKLSYSLGTDPVERRFLLAKSGVCKSLAGLDLGDDAAHPVEVTPAANDAPRECCKVCRSGQACGDSCISNDKTCDKPAGCAC